MFVNKKLKSIDYSKLTMYKEEAPIYDFKVSKSECTYFIDDVFNLILVSKITKGEFDLFHAYPSNKINGVKIATIQKNINSNDTLGPYYVNNNTRFPLFKADSVFSEAREKLLNLRDIIG